MTNYAFVLTVHDFLKQKKISMDSLVKIKDKSGLRIVTSVRFDDDADTILSTDGKKPMLLEQVYTKIAATQSMIFANAITENPTLEYDDFLIDDVYVEDGTLIVEHV